MRPNARSLTLVYAYRVEAHYHYAHISSDAAMRQNMHNGMFHVFGGERVRISSLEGPESFPAKDWTPVKLVYDGDSGRFSHSSKNQARFCFDAVSMTRRKSAVDALLSR